MNHFFIGMTTLNQAFWWVAIVASVIFILQTLFFLIGTDHSAGAGDTGFPDTPDGPDLPFQMFTLRNLVNFLLGFGWAGVTFYDRIPNSFLLILAALAIGILFVLIFFLIIRQFLKLSEDNTFDVNKLVGHIGDVYLAIPANMSGKGKVQISFRGTNHELQAMTKEEMLPTGVAVKVEHVEDNILIVKKVIQ